MHGDFWYRSYLTLHRDISGVHLLLRLKIDLNRRMAENRGLNKIFMDLVEKHSCKVAIIDIETNRTFTFAEFNCEMNKYANYFKSLGYKNGDVVALFMENSVNFVSAWMGLSKIGVITAWINSNLKMEPLAHCINASKAKSIISSVQMCQSVKEISDQKLIDENIEIFSLGNSKWNCINLCEILSSTSSDEPQNCKDVDFKSALCFIYTSGTTGLPKAAVIKHYRFYSMVTGVAHSFRITPCDRIYLAMPLYHTAAGILGIGQTIIFGSSTVIRRKFSASNFWKDCVNYECTVSQYIGEICRYLLAQPKIPEERIHKIHLMYGNGLRGEIWQDFVDRFGVRIGEVYGSTEGTSNLVNIDGKVGACGFLPISPLTSFVHPVRLVKVDETTGEVIRRHDGLCVPCRPGQTGAMVSTIKSNNPLLIFEGYLNQKETSKKVLKNVFKKGDSVFVSGDILHWDKLGYLYFKDRTGDTYRWKGENVSTTEVEAILQPLNCVADATVYGVTVPGHEGKAGMAAIVKSDEAFQDNQMFLDEIGAKILNKLPSYAAPVFIRLCKSVDKTGTYKLVKTHLQNLGYQPDSKNGHVFYKNAKSNKYVPLDSITLQLIDSAQFSGL